MKGIALALILISPLSFADWGDVYYCQMTTFSETSFEGKRTDYVLQKFQFKLDKTKNAMVFGKSGYFEGSVMELREEFDYPSVETWLAESTNDILFFREGMFLYSILFDRAIASITANCDKF